MAVSAWRTSSSLNGLIMATTSFMVRPSFLEFWRSARPDLRPGKSGIFLCKWHKKLQLETKNNCCGSLRLVRLVHGTGHHRRNSISPAAVLQPADRDSALGNKMTGRSWFFASQGQQQGPYADAKLREYIANGTVTAETLVWTEGMAGWQKAGDIPGLLSAASSLRTFSASGLPATTGDIRAAQSLSIDFN